MPGCRDLGPPDSTQTAFPSRFHVLRRLGVGGMAEVFSAIHHEAGGYERPVVIKRPLPDLAAHPEFLAMFLDEARIASSLQHPNIVRVFEVIHQPDSCLIVMELVEGKSVSSLLARLERCGQRLESRLAAHIVARAAQGLHYAHTRTDPQGQPLKIVHRDVSPQNVLVSFTGEVKVIDFGIAHALGRVTQTRTGTRKGKTGYMAPEQARAGTIDSRVDVFALGILLWELSCGRRLFVRPDDFRSMNALLVDPIPLPSSIAAVPPALESIIMRALARDPDQRFQTADEVRAALDAFTTSVGGALPAELGALVKVLFAANAPTLRQDSGLEIAPAVVTAATAPVPRRGYDRRQLAMLGAGSVVACTLGAALGWVGNHFGVSPVGKVSASARKQSSAGALSRVLTPAPPAAAPAMASPPKSPAAVVSSRPIGGATRPAHIAASEPEKVLPDEQAKQDEQGRQDLPETSQASLAGARSPRSPSVAALRLRRLRAKSNPF